MSTTKAPYRTRDLDEAEGLTEEEFMALPDPPDGRRLELVRGRVVNVPPASPPHQTVAHSLARVWEDAAGPLRDPRALGGPRARGLVVVDVYGRTSPAGTPPRRRTLRAPDVAFYATERYGGPLRVGSLPVAPTLALELLSPDDTWEAMAAKAAEYLRAGTSAVWVLDVYPGHPSRAGAPGVPPPGVWARRYRLGEALRPRAAAAVEVVDLPASGPEAVVDARPFLDAVVPLPAIYATAGLLPVDDAPVDAGA
jgi:Uma2 family endonuclease